MRPLYKKARRAEDARARKGARRRRENEARIRKYTQDDRVTLPVSVVVEEAVENEPADPS